MIDFRTSVRLENLTCVGFFKPNNKQDSCELQYIAGVNDSFVNHPENIRYRPDAQILGSPFDSLDLSNFEFGGSRKPSNGSKRIAKVLCRKAILYRPSSLLVNPLMKPVRG